MRKWMLACAVVTVAGFWAVPAPAQESIPAPTQTVSSAQTVTTMQPRTGLFSRLRARRQMTVVSEPMVASSTTAVTTMPRLTPVQQAQGTQTPSTVQQAQYPPTQGGVQQAQATMPAASTTMPATITTTEYVAPRQGLLARLLARRGY
jgi:hypothetical protein